MNQVRVQEQRQVSIEFDESERALATASQKNVLVLLCPWRAREKIFQSQTYSCVIHALLKEDSQEDAQATPRPPTIRPNLLPLSRSQFSLARFFFLVVAAVSHAHRPVPSCETENFPNFLTPASLNQCQSDTILDILNLKMFIAVQPTHEHCDPSTRPKMS